MKTLTRRLNSERASSAITFQNRYRRLRAADARARSIHIDEKTPSLERESRLAQTVDEQRDYVVRIKRLNGLKKRKRAELFQMEDEIEAKRDALISALEKRCRQQVERTRLFAVEWEVT